jgi:hypothetical protein
VRSSRFTDAQCGFKAVRRDVARELVPIVADNGWFFDTELLVLAERSGLRVHEVPVDWVDDPDSRVDIVRTALDDLKGIWRLLRTRPHELGRLTAPAVARHDEWYGAADREPVGDRRQSAGDDRGAAGDDSSVIGGHALRSPS